MEYLRQPFKLDNSGLESTITLSLRLIFMKNCDNDIGIANEKPDVHNYDNEVSLYDLYCVLFTFSFKACDNSNI